jgi:hypothetical protein
MKEKIVFIVKHFFSKSSCNPHKGDAADKGNVIVIIGENYFLLLRKLYFWYPVNKIANNQLILYYNLKLNLN